jgi:Myb/SANT-like DNA-binding domain
MGSPRKKRSQWDDAKDLFLIQHLIKATKQGKKSDSGFKKDVWNEVAKLINHKFGVKPALTYKQVQTRMHAV